MHAESDIEEGISAESTECPPQLETVLLWYRRDLRVTDNKALVAAREAAKRVIPVYVWAPEEEGQFQPGRCSRFWLNHSLAALERDLKALGSRLIYRRAKESKLALLELIKETGAEGVFFSHLYDPLSVVQDGEIKDTMREMKIHCFSFAGDVLYEPWEVVNPVGQPYTCFDDFWSRVLHMTYPPAQPLPVPPQLPAVAEDIGSESRETLELTTPEEEDSNHHLLSMWSPGGMGAFSALQKFVLDKLLQFGQKASRADCDGTSRLSPHIHFGEISIAFVYHVVRQQCGLENDESTAQSCAAVLRQIGFREYSRYLSFHFPVTHKRPLLAHLQAAPFLLDKTLFKAWKQGNTGYPMVDAAMRQLWSTGWLHNRSRVICASFLVKNLLLPWQWGLKHFWDCLLDADLESNALGWQYCSGCLADAPPFGWMPDHLALAQANDPEGKYVRRWIPALSRLPAKWIHRPWESPAQVLFCAGVELGVNYPKPIVWPEESRKNLHRAAKVVQKAFENSPLQQTVPFRPSTVAQQLRGKPAEAWECQQSDSAALPFDLETAQSEMSESSETNVSPPPKRRRESTRCVASQEEEVFSNVL